MNRQVTRLAEKIRKNMLKFGFKAASDYCASVPGSHVPDNAENWARMIASFLSLLEHHPRLPIMLRDQLRPHSQEWERFAENVSKRRHSEAAAALVGLKDRKKQLESLLDEALKL